MHADTIGDLVARDDASSSSFSPWPVLSVCVCQYSACAHQKARRSYSLVWTRYILASGILLLGNTSTNTSAIPGPPFSIRPC